MLLSWPLRPHAVKLDVVPGDDSIAYMFIGHFAPALVAATRPGAPGLGTLFVATQLVDIGFAALLVPGIEAMRVVPGITAMNAMDLYHMPYTHSLLGAALWGGLFALLVGAITHRRDAALLAGLVVVSHWFIDLLVHIPDLTLYGGPPKLGFGLWNEPLVAMSLEIAIAAGALFYYARRTTAHSGNRRIWLLAGLLAAAQAVDWFGPKPTAYSIDIPAMMLFIYALLASVAAWGGSGRRRIRAKGDA